MKVFKDNEGRTWSIVIHVAAAKRVKALLNLDIYGLAVDGFTGLAALLQSPIDLVDLLFVLCENECKERNLTDEQFGRGFAGDTIRTAADAFIAELIDFFPEQKARTALQKVVTLSRQVQEKMIDEAQTKIDEIDIDGLVRTLSERSGVSPVSSESIPGRSPSVNST